MRTIKLNRQSWAFDETKPLGPKGGFGQVFAGDGNVAVKRINVDASQAKRELTLADTLAGQQFANIVPVLDAGEDATGGGYFVVMERCEKSLDQYLAATASLIPVNEAIAILKQIANGLGEVGNIVHRDLKPANVLLQNDTWKIADFGIARFVEETTSLNTMRDCLTPPFAAPEQWKNERATKATDVYALGCIGYVLLTGRPPFNGEIAELQKKHLFEEPPPLSGSLPPKLRSIITLALRKSPGVRPTVDRIHSILGTITAAEGQPKPKNDALSQLDASISAERLKQEAEQRRKHEEQAHRMELAKEGYAELRKLRKDLFDLILESAPNAHVTDDTLRLGPAEISVTIAKRYEAETPHEIGTWLGPRLIKSTIR